MQTLQYTSDYVISMDTLMLDHQYGEAINTKQERNEMIVGPAALIVPFVACGDLSGFDYDPDKSYPCS